MESPVTRPRCARAIRPFPAGLLGAQPLVDDRFWIAPLPVARALASRR